MYSGGDFTRLGKAMQSICSCPLLPTPRDAWTVHAPKFFAQPVALNLSMSRANHRAQNVAVAGGPLIAGRVSIIFDGLAHSGAMTFAVQHTQICAPRTHGRPIPVGHDSGHLVQVREVVSCPCRHQL